MHAVRGAAVVEYTEELRGSFSSKSRGHRAYIVSFWPWPVGV